MLPHTISPTPSPPPSLGSDFLEQPMCLSAQSCPTLWTIACQAPLSMEFFRQEYWNGLPFPTSGDLSDPGINLHFLNWQACLFFFFYHGTTWEAPEEA